MADEDDCPPFRLELAHQREQVLDLGGGEDGSRLVENQDVGAAIEETQDLQDLAHVDRRIGGSQAPVDHDACKRGDPVGFGLRLAPIDQAAKNRGFARQYQVFQERQRRRKHELLMDHADAAREGVGRPIQPDRLIVEHDRPLVGNVDALQDAHQRRLAGPVAADDGVDRSRSDGEIDAIVGDDSAEPARDATPSHAYRYRLRHLKKSGYP